MTVQGQTVSSNFGTVDSAQFNIEQLRACRNLQRLVFSTKSDPDRRRGGPSYQKWLTSATMLMRNLRDHDYFAEYLSEVSPLQFYGETNIGSRPSKRKNSGKLELKDLRAIPFVGAFSQLKQNVTGYYGVGMPHYGNGKNRKMETC